MRKANLFIERSLVGALVLLKESMFAQESCAKKGFLQAREPRAKIAAIGMLLLSVLLSRNTVFIAGMYGVCLILALASGVSFWYFIKRTWIFIPLFSLCIALPAVFETFSPGDPVFVLRFFSGVFVITRQGLDAAVVFFLRVLTSVSLAVLLSLTTRQADLLKALRSFGVPRVFVMTLGMCTRYIYMFIEVLQNTYLAIKSRVGHVSSVRKGQKVVAWNIASLWQHSYQLQSQVYGAMVSRGYTGEPHVLSQGRPSFKDWIWLLTIGALFLGEIWTR